MTSESDAASRRIADLQAQQAGLVALAARVAAASSVLPVPGAACWASEARNRYDERLVGLLQSLNAVRAVLEDGADAAGALAARIAEDRARAIAASTGTGGGADVLAAFGVGAAATGSWP
ncbi:hypothetical protein [Agromyces mangrovi Wang et al. 2018]|uniref:hypothetical protein n=1 Tax=Agromyces mangrovi TaxID=1858653 RepID=UPI00257472EF|nr:hypothetical protein [Agromyces mangrovi]BDZ64575.1 hypothetical protein GCM10025877_15130 [Agromyces mangrovi]